MIKGLLRLTIIGVALYFMVCYYFAQGFGIDLLCNTYTLLFEFIVFLIVWKDDSKYFCKFIKWTMGSILLTDTISHLDYYFNFISVGIYNYLCSFILCAGFGTSCVLAIRHFIQVLKLKRKVHAHNARNTR